MRMAECIIAELEQENTALRGELDGLDERVAALEQGRDGASPARAEFLSNGWFGLLGLMAVAGQWGWRRRDALLRALRGGWR